MCHNKIKMSKCNCAPNVAPDSLLACTYCFHKTSREIEREAAEYYDTPQFIPHNYRHISRVDYFPRSLYVYV